VALGIILNFFFLHGLVLNIFPFPVSTEKILGNFYNNRRSAANSFPRFAYSFVVLMLRQYYWRWDSYSANRRSAANIKKSAKTSYWLYEFAPASPIGVASFSPLCLLAPNATHANKITRGSYIAPILLTLRRSAPLHLLIQNSPKIFTVLTRNGNMAKLR
jgi:hypothetical protein